MMCKSLAMQQRSGMIFIRAGLILLFALFLPLLASGAGLSKELAAAARAGDLAKVKALIAQGADPNSFDDHGFTPTSGAVFYGKKDVVKYLLQNGADVNKNSKDGSTALIQACFRENSTIVKLLLEYGADVNKKNSVNGWTSLMTAVTSNDNLDITSVLLENGAKINEKNKERLTALLLVSAVCDSRRGNYLISRGADKSSRADNGYTYFDYLSAPRCKGGGIKR